MDTDDRLQRLEYQLWGLNGQNGIVSEVRGLRKEMSDWRMADLAKAERQRKDSQVRAEEKRKERKSDVRWRIGTAIAIVTAILMAAGIVANAL